MPLARRFVESRRPLLPEEGKSVAPGWWETNHDSRFSRRGFTLIELIVVMAIVALLLTIAVPRYFVSIDRSKETVLKQSLVVMRDALDKFYGDVGRYPNDLDELVARRYLRNLPVDPVTERADTWQIVAPPSDALKGAVYDVRSGAPGAAAGGVPYGDF